MGSLNPSDRVRRGSTVRLNSSANTQTRKEAVATGVFQAILLSPAARDLTLDHVWIPLERYVISWSASLFIMMEYWMHAYLGLVSSSTSIIESRQADLAKVKSHARNTTDQVRDQDRHSTSSGTCGKSADPGMPAWKVGYMSKIRNTCLTSVSKAYQTGKDLYILLTALRWLPKQYKANSGYEPVPQVSSPGNLQANCAQNTSRRAFCLIFAPFRNHGCSGVYLASPRQWILSYSLARVLTFLAVLQCCHSVNGLPINATGAGQMTSNVESDPVGLLAASLDVFAKYVGDSLAEVLYAMPKIMILILARWSVARGNDDDDIHTVTRAVYAWMSVVAVFLFDDRLRKIPELFFCCWALLEYGNMLFKAVPRYYRMTCITATGLLACLQTILATLYGPPLHNKDKHDPSDLWLWLPPSTLVAMIAVWTGYNSLQRIAEMSELLRNCLLNWLTPTPRS